MASKDTMKMSQNGYGPTMNAIGRAIDTPMPPKGPGRATPMSMQVWIMKQYGLKTDQDYAKFAKTKKGLKVIQDFMEYHQMGQK